MILADTSAWVEYDRATGSAVHLRMRALVGDAEALCITEPVVMEVCVGARSDDRELQLRRLLGASRLLPFDGGDIDQAVTVYRTCRRRGVTPRGLVDCMIAAVALRHGVVVLAHDHDFATMAGVVGLELDRASLGAS